MEVSSDMAKAIRKSCIACQGEHLPESPQMSTNKREKNFQKIDSVSFLGTSETRVIN